MHTCVLCVWYILSTIRFCVERKMSFFLLFAAAVEHHSTQYFDMLSIIVGYFLPFGICIVVRVREILDLELYFGHAYPKTAKKKSFSIGFYFYFCLIEFYCGITIWFRLFYTFTYFFLYVVLEAGMRNQLYRVYLRCGSWRVASLIACRNFLGLGNGFLQRNYRLSISAMIVHFGVS